MLNLDVPSQHMELLEHPWMLHSFDPAQGRSYWELLRDCCAEAGASSREADCTGRYMTRVCTWWQEGQQEQLALGTEAREGSASSADPWTLQAVKAPAFLFSQVCCASVEANFTLLPAKPGVMLVQYHRRGAPLLSLNWELNTVLGAATGHAELSLFKGLGLCKQTKGTTKPYTMKATLNERFNERKKSCQNVKVNVFIKLTRECLGVMSVNFKLN